MQILSIGAHPDDIEILCGGTLAKYRNSGHQVTMACATPGELGHMEIMPEELSNIRKEETRQAAKLIGAESICLEMPDEWLFHTKEVRLIFIDLIRQAKPDVIITHSPQDYHPDHRNCFDLVFAASFLATVPHIHTQHPPHHKVAPIYLMDTIVGVGGFTPTDYVDISDTIEVKRAMLECHKSQLKWLKEHDNIDIVDVMLSVAKFRGLQANCGYAEAFQLLQVWPRVVPQRLLP